MKRVPLFLALTVFLLLFTYCKPKEEKAETVEVTTSVEHPLWSRDITLYEVNIRQYTPEGTFNAFRNYLPRLKELGVDLLWLMPINPIGQLNRKGPLGSYYSVKDYTAVNPEFGTLEDFKELVDATHSLGMHLIIDWVPNHTAWDHPWVTEHPDWYAKDSTGNMYSPWDWTDVVQLDYENTDMRAAMIDAMKYWLTDAEIDGFRCDVAHQVPVDFWNEVRPALQEVDPDVFLLAEAEKREFHEDAFDMTYAWEFHHIMNEVAQGTKNVTAMDDYFKMSAVEYNPNDMRLYFTSNHDENSWNGTVFERMGDAAEVMAVLTYLIPGAPLIYNGQEAGLNKRLLFFEKDEIPWNDHPFSQLYYDLNQLKKKNSALWNPGFGGDYERISTSADDKILAFKRVLDNNSVLAIFNLSPEDQTITLSGFDRKESYIDWFSDRRTDITGDPIKIKSWGYLIYTK